MMIAILLFALVSCTLAFPQIEVRSDHSISQSLDHVGQGGYHLVTSGGIDQRVQNELAYNPDGSLYLRSVGNVAYISPEGIPIRWSYIADNNGYRASGTGINGAGQL